MQAGSAPPVLSQTCRAPASWSGLVAVDCAHDGRRHCSGRSVEGDAPSAKADDARGIGHRGLELVLTHDEREPLRVDRVERVHDAAGERVIDARVTLVLPAYTGEYGLRDEIWHTSLQY